MIRRHPVSNSTATLLPYPTLFRSSGRCPRSPLVVAAVAPLVYRDPRRIQRQVRRGLSVHDRCGTGSGRKAGNCFPSAKQNGSQRSHKRRDTAGIFVRDVYAGGRGSEIGRESGGGGGGREGEK